MENMNQLEYLIDFLKTKGVKIKVYPIFYLYLILVVIGIGGFSIWTTFFFDFNKPVFSQNIKLALMSFSLPITASFAIDIFKIDNEENFIKVFFQIIVTTIPLMLLVLFVVFFNSNWSYVFSLLNLLLALFFWWIINSSNPNLCDPTFYNRMSERTRNMENAIK